MSEANNVEDVKKQEVHEDSSNNQASDKDANNESMPSPQQEEDAVRKKYGGKLPKKAPLISKDHERAYFDSADWALGKQGAQKPKGPLEALRPKLQPTHQQTRSRRSAYAPADGSEVGGDNAELEDPSASEDVSGNKSDAAQDQKQP
uniref:Endosulphine n=1 Tax=Medicago truncatula TaxID=3880 RepID=I3S9L7_MEDTR|nr:unknown [Medicago truncatula]